MSKRPRERTVTERLVQALSVADAAMELSGKVSDQRRKELVEKAHLSIDEALRCVNEITAALSAIHRTG